MVIVYCTVLSLVVRIKLKTFAAKGETLRLWKCLRASARGAASLFLFNCIFSLINEQHG